MYTDIIPFFFFQAEDGIRDADVTGVQTCALPIAGRVHRLARAARAGPGAARAGAHARSTQGAAGPGPEDGAPDREGRLRARRASRASAAGRSAAGAARREGPCRWSRDRGPE